MGELKAPTPSTPGSSDVGPEPLTTAVPGFSAPTEARPAPTEDTPICESATADAWSGETEPIDRDRQCRRKTWVIIAAIVTLAAIVVVAAVWFGYLAWPRASQSDSPSAAPSPTPAPNAAPLPAPMPTSAQASPTPNVGVPMEVVATYDRQFLKNMVAKGWIITNPEAMVKNAHRTCALFQKGVTPDEVNQQLVTGTGMTMYEAIQFSSTAMLTYPDCP